MMLEEVRCRDPVRGHDPIARSESIGQRGIPHLVHVERRSILHPFDAQREAEREGRRVPLGRDVAVMRVVQAVPQSKQRRLEREGRRGVGEQGLEGWEVVLPGVPQVLFGGVGEHVVSA
jgi:hypothetical protein